MWDVFFKRSCRCGVFPLCPSENHFTANYVFPLDLITSSFSVWQRRWIYSEEVFPWQTLRELFICSSATTSFFLFCFIDTDEDTVKRCFATFEEKFFQTCEKELAKINIFYSGKVLICVYLWKIQQHKKSLKLPYFQNNHSGHAGLPSGIYRAKWWETALVWRCS